MNLILEKERIRQRLELVNDESVILSVEKVLGMIKDQRLEPLTKEEVVARAMMSEDDIKDNRFITLDELEDEMKNW